MLLPLDLSSYTPKHSADFTAWQEKKLSDSTDSGDANSQPDDMSDEMMVSHLFIQCSGKVQKDLKDFLFVCECESKSVS